MVLRWSLGKFYHYVVDLHIVPAHRPSANVDLDLRLLGPIEVWTRRLEAEGRSNFAAWRPALVRRFRRPNVEVVECCSANFRRIKPSSHARLANCSRCAAFGRRKVTTGPTFGRTNVGHECEAGRSIGWTRVEVVDRLPALALRAPKTDPHTLHTDWAVRHFVSNRSAAKLRQCATKAHLQFAKHFVAAWVVRRVWRERKNPINSSDDESNLFLPVCVYLLLELLRTVQDLCNAVVQLAHRDAVFNAFLLCFSTVG